MANVEGEAMEVDSTFHSARVEDTEEGLIDDDPFCVETRYESRGSAFTTGINMFSREEQRKMEERAKRFGIKDKARAIVENDEDLYSSVGIAEESENTRYIRLNVLHMRGTEDMGTKDVFKYFEDYAPASIEWISESSCNVVWLDNISAARALLGLSKRITGLPDALNADEKEKYANGNSLVEVDDKQNENTIDFKEIRCPLPPGPWRKGKNYPKSPGIFLRFATRADKQQPRDEKMSEHYKRYGNPNFEGMRGILTESRKRQYKQIRRGRSRNHSEGDEKEEKKKKKNPWGELSENWGAAEDVEDHYINRLQFQREPEPVQENIRLLERGSIKERLGMKPAKEIPTVLVESSESSESQDSEEEWGKRSKIPRMRMHADDEEEKVKKKKLRQMSKKLQEESKDLRSRLLGRRRPPPPVFREAIQVIVTNTPEKYRSRVEEGEVEMVVESEKEEGEWEEEVEEFEEVEEELPEEEEEVEEEEEESDSSTSSSDISEKEIQGPKGSVIKVVPRSKPRVASTVWARLNYNHQDDNFPSESSGNSRRTLKSDLRSRLGQVHNRERSPLRIEVKNDKFDGANESE